MEYANGGSLYDWLQNEQRMLPDELKLRFCKQAMAAIGYLHHQGIIHRDIKSLNFMVAESKILKLGDFGFAKVKGVCSSTVKSKSTTIGSARWSAPETFDDEYKWTEKADIFSLGMTIYEILTRKVPFENQTKPDVIIGLMIRGKKPTIPSEFKDHPLVAVITLAWQQDPQQRPTALELKAKLPPVTTEIIRLQTLDLNIETAIKNLLHEENRQKKHWHFFSEEIFKNDQLVRWRDFKDVHVFWNSWISRADGTIDVMINLCLKFDRQDILDVLESHGLY
jgi:serine/threonine protein kinase